MWASEYDIPHRRSVYKILSRYTKARIAPQSVPAVYAVDASKDVACVPLDTDSVCGYDKGRVGTCVFHYGPSAVSLNRARCCAGIKFDFADKRTVTQYCVIKRQ